MQLTRAVAQDLAADLRAQARHAADINEGDWVTPDDAANDLDRAIDAAAGLMVEVPAEVVEIAQACGLL